MGTFIAEVITDLLLCFEDIKFWFKKRKRRKYERENDLPKKLMLYPSQIIYLKVVGISGVIVFFISVFWILFYPDIGEKKTSNKINEIAIILEKEKKDIGNYPLYLKEIIRNNPLRKNITKDYWKREFYYESLNNGRNYTLLSLGKDGKFKTEDDIKFKK